MGNEHNLNDFAEEYIKKGRKKFGRTPTYGEIEEIINEEKKKQICENCGKGIDVSETALKLCDDCFDEKCECGHIRAQHVNNKGSCIHEYNLNHKTKRGEFCKCKKFKKNGKN